MAVNFLFIYVLSNECMDSLLYTLTDGWPCFSRGEVCYIEVSVVTVVPRGANQQAAKAAEGNNNQQEVWIVLYLNPFRQTVIML